VKKKRNRTECYYNDRQGAGGSWTASAGRPPEIQRNKNKVKGEENTRRVRGVSRRVVGRSVVMLRPGGLAYGGRKGGLEKHTLANRGKRHRHRGRHTVLCWHSWVDTKSKRHWLKSGGRRLSRLRPVSQDKNTSDCPLGSRPARRNQLKKKKKIKKKKKKKAETLDHQGQTLLVGMFLSLGAYLSEPPQRTAGDSVFLDTGYTKGLEHPSCDTWVDLNERMVGPMGSRGARKRDFSQIS